MELKSSRSESLGREKVGIEAVMIGEGAVRGREREGEGGTQERGREEEMVIDGGERRRGGGLIHVHVQQFSIAKEQRQESSYIAAINNLEAGTGLERDIADISVPS